MSVVGLTFGEPFTQLCVLDSAGQVIEHGRVRSTEAALRHRFAAMLPSTIALPYDPRVEHLIRVLSELGHSVLISGPVPAHLCIALAPLVRERLASTRMVARRSAEEGLSFLIEAEAQSGPVVVSRAWYFAGPVSAESFSAMPARRFAGPVDAHLHAAKLYECSAIDPAMLSFQKEYRRVTAA